MYNFLKQNKVSLFFGLTKLEKVELYLIWLSILIEGQYIVEAIVFERVGQLALVTFIEIAMLHFVLMNFSLLSNRLLQTSFLHVPYVL